MMKAKDRSRLKGLVFLILLISVMGSCRSASDIKLETSETRPPTYLQDVIPPCTPLAGSGQDPCALSASAVDAVVASADVEISDAPPTLEEIMLGKNPGEPELLVGSIRHIVVRGTVRPGTTRCQDYYLKLPNYLGEQYRDNEGLIYAYCFMDVRINEYLVGEGPPELTVSRRSAILSDLEIDSLGAEGEWAELASETAEEYEGKEVVLFLRLPFTLTLEAFVFDGGFDVWWVQRSEGDDGDEVRAVAQGIQFIRTAANRSLADIPLAELETRIAEEAVNRTAVTGGRIGIDASLPLLISDANDIRTHYKAIGAVYVTTESPEDDYENVTFPPPPAPGDGDPVQPPITTGEEGYGSSGTVPAPGDGDLPGNSGGGTVP